MLWIDAKITSLLSIVTIESLSYLEISTRFIPCVTIEALSYLEISTRILPCDLSSPKVLLRIKFFTLINSSTFLLVTFAIP